MRKLFLSLIFILVFTPAWAAQSTIGVGDWVDIRGDINDNFTELYNTEHTQDTDTALGTLGTKAVPIDADKVVQRDSAAADALVTSTWTQIKVFLKTYFDTIYAAVLGVDDNYVTDAEKVVIGNTSGTNTGDDPADDTAYNATSWDANIDAATKNAIRDKIESLAGGHSEVTLNASATTGGMSLSTQEISNRAATNAQTGYATDSHITAIEANTSKTTNATHSGDATGATVLTLATVNSNVGSFTNADLTVNAKGLVTAVANGASGSGDLKADGTIPLTADWDAGAFTITAEQIVVSGGVSTGSGTSDGGAYFLMLEDTDNGTNYSGWGVFGDLATSTLYMFPLAAPNDQILQFAAPGNQIMSDGSTKSVSIGTWVSLSGGDLGSNLSSTTDNITSDNGTIRLNSSGGTNNEDLDFDFETTGNNVGISSTTGVTHVDFGAIGIITDSTITGRLWTTTNSGAQALSVANYHGGSVLATAAAQYTLPSAEDGFNGCIQAGQGVTAIIQLIPAAGDFIVQSGVRGTAATALKSSGAAGDRICYIANDADDWYITTIGTWAE